MRSIYVIRCDVSDKVYVGQSEERLNDRFRKHRADANMIIKSRNDPTYNTDTPHFKLIRHRPLYTFMADIGIEHFSIHLIEEVEDDVADERECWHIATFNCIEPNGLNTSTGGRTGSNRSQACIEREKQTKLERLDDNRHEILRGCPPCLSYGREEGKDQWIYIQNHPQCKSKYFFLKKYGTIEAARDAAVAFIAELETTGVSYKRPKKEPDLKEYPGLKATKKGYKIEKQIKGKKISAGFESQKNSREANKEAAISWYQANIIPKLTPQPAIVVDPQENQDIAEE